jgi:hypothetical protein
VDQPQEQRTRVSALHEEGNEAVEQAELAR